MKEFERRQPGTVRSKVDNAATMVWLEESLQYARDGGPDGIEDLLVAVRREVLFEMDLAGNESPGGGVNGER